MAFISVLTGDLVGSTRAARPAKFRSRLAALLARLQEKYQASTTLYRGDGFQVALGADVNAFEVALVLRSGLIAASPARNSRWDARVAIAFGAGAIGGSDDDHNSETYINSGRVLDDMTKEHLRVHSDIEVVRLGLESATAFADDILDHLTPVEAEVLYYYFLEHENHQQIAERLAKQRPTVTVALQRAKYSQLELYIRNMDQLIRLNHAGD